MATVRPFAALRPKATLASRICELPYDVMSADEARQMAAGNPWSFLRVSRPEIELPADTDPYAPAVYARGAANFRHWIAAGALVKQPRASYFLYRQVMGGHRQVGWVALASCEEYLAGVVRKHEHTRPDKEDDRVRHIEALGAQTGPAFLVFRAESALDAHAERLMEGQPDVDFVAPDGVRHTAWTLDDMGRIVEIEAIFRAIPRLYIADGHHRTAAAARVYRSRGGAGEAGGFLAVLFPHDQVQIMPYHRVLKDLGDLNPGAFLESLREAGELRAGGTGQTARAGEVGVYVAGRWYTLELDRSGLASSTPAERLDVALLQRHVLEPILGVTDPRTSDRIAFVGGVRGVGELKRLVDEGRYACAFAMHPTRIEELLEVADGGDIMPPKSTWFEPKLRDGMFSHLLE